MSSSPSSPSDAELAGSAASESVDTFTIANDTAHSEAEWYTRVYQGDNMPQLTVRAVLMGAVIGALMSAANLYTTLKVGWSFGVAITAVVISYVSWNLIRMLSGSRVSQMSILENNCMASTASAAGYSTGSTIATGFGALLLMQGYHQHWLAVGLFTLFTGALGVFIAVPMKRQMVNQEKLPFPTGLAAATTLRSLYSRGADALRKAYALLAALVAGVMVGLLKASEGAVGAIDWVRAHSPIPLRLPDLVPADGYYLLRGRQMVGFGFEPSLLLIGAGMIVGARVALSMLAGAALLYFWIGPQLIAMDAANATVADYVVSVPIVGGGTIYHLPRWGLWGGTAVMVFASLTALALQWRTIARSFTNWRRRGTSSQDAAEARMTAIEVPVMWLLVGLVPISVGLLVVQYFAFGISMWLGLVAIAMSFLISLVASRATGETDTTPIGAMGKIMQLLFAVLSPGNVPHNLVAASTAANSASASADLLTDLKSGYMLGANPRKQFIAQFIGIFFGTLAVVPAWYLMVPNKEVLEAMNPPATNMWRAMAELLVGGGVDLLPMSARIAVVGGALVGVLIPLLGKLLPRFAPYMPSAMGLGLAWVMQFKDAQAFAIGAVGLWLWGRFSRKSADDYGIPVASGFIAGESLAAAGVAILATVLGLIAAGS